MFTVGFFNASVECVHCLHAVVQCGGGAATDVLLFCAQCCSTDSACPNGLVMPMVDHSSCFFVVVTSSRAKGCVH
jgi:hypothetical protein